MAKFHVNDKGDVLPCRAGSAERCPVSAPEGMSGNNHFDDKEMARAEYEKNMESFAISPIAQKNQKRGSSVSRRSKKFRKVFQKAASVAGIAAVSFSLAACDDSLSDISSYIPDSSSSSDSSSSQSSKDLSNVYFQGRPLKPSQEEVDEAYSQLSKLEVREELKDVYYDRKEMYGRSFQTGVVGRLEHRDIPEGVFKNSAPQSRAIGGSFVDPYTGEEVEVVKGSSQDTNVDHIVPLKEATESQRHEGEMSESKRKEIANDPENLIVVGASVNKEKSDSDIADWIPSYEPSQCIYVVQSIKVRDKYDLTVDSREAKAMKEVLDSKC